MKAELARISLGLNRFLRPGCGAASHAGCRPPEDQAKGDKLNPGSWTDWLHSSRLIAAFR